MHLNMSFSGAIPHKLTQQIGILRMTIRNIIFSFLSIINYLRYLLLINKFEISSLKRLEVPNILL